MARFFSVLALFCLALTPARAQDMPLSDILIDGEGWKKVKEPGAAPKPAAEGTAMYLMRPTDSGTVFAWAPHSSCILACQAHADGKLVTLPMPYAPLRTKRGEKTIGVGGVVLDRDGRIYAATDLGVQVFDPTGRLCGVLTPAVPGKPEHLAFEGDQLTLWVGDEKYARKLSAHGTK